MSKTTIIQVAIATPLRRLFDYLPPSGVMAEDLHPGCRVQVPFRNKSVTGIIMHITDHSDVPEEKLKSAIACVDKTPILDSHCLKLGRWASDYYQYPIGEVVVGTLPKLLRQGQPACKKPITAYQLTELGQGVDLDTLTRAPKQQDALRLLRQQVNPIARHDLADVSSGTLKALVDKQWLETVDVIQSPVPRTTQQPNYALNDDQQQAFAAITESLGAFKAFLLDGVTGSGKTEVYLRTIDEVLKRGEQALVMVPEIALTPQTVKRFSERFATPIAVLHSGLNDRERLDAWIMAQTGEAGIIIGTRSAIFTPIATLGMIIIDESHDGSFKQQDGFRYSARDLSLIRGQMHKAPVILGSATPGLESLRNAASGRYECLKLTQRAGHANLPNYRILDIRNRQLLDGLSNELLAAISDHLRQDSQVLLFLNRRGYAPTLICNSCGWVGKCQRCDANMTLHMKPRHLHCHHCDASCRIPHQCPQCDSEHLHALGLGTERLEQTLSEQFPEAEVFRIDRDTIRSKSALETTLAKIHNGKRQILIGTQMLAKGHHFPNVTLVAILDADAGFFSADFRASERVAQLLVQVAGRAGRAEKPGDVVIQTRNPQHPQLLRLIHEGYHSFAEETLQERKMARLPPYTYFAMLRAESHDKELPRTFLQQAKTLASELGSDGVFVLGPIASPMEKRAGRYRSQLLFQANQRKDLQSLLGPLSKTLETSKKSPYLRWSLDIDPIDMF